MNIDEAKAVLSLAEKFELQDHTFGDTEVNWKIDDEEVAVGYFSRQINEVSVKKTKMFSNDEARELRKCFAKQTIERNDGGE